MITENNQAEEAIDQQTATPEEPQKVDEPKQPPQEKNCQFFEKIKAYRNSSRKAWFFAGTIIAVILMIATGMFIVTRKKR
jgi:hypothetical protein